MLVAVIMLFLVLSFTGVAVLDIAQNSSDLSMNTVKNIKVQYVMESAVNKSLWKINSGVDSLVNTSGDGYTCSYDSTSGLLTVTTDTLDIVSEVQIDLSEDTHFDRGIAAEETINLEGGNVTWSEDHAVREGFGFLPDVDLDYFMDNAVTVHSQNFYSYNNLTLEDGIHVFTGSLITLSNITLESGTLVFTGRFIIFGGNNNISAPGTDSLNVDPALVFTNPKQSFILHGAGGEDTIRGAIYCARNITLIDGNITGPVIAKKVFINDDFDLLDVDNAHYFGWNRGFGERSDYDWPKQISRWKTTRWSYKDRG